MMFLVSDIKGKFESFGTTHYLEPISYPEVDISNILVAEDSLGKRILRTCPHILRAQFEASKIPSFPSPIQSPKDILDESKVIILRGGGIGDLILLIPAIRIFKNLLPKGAEMVLATFQDKMPLFEGIPEITELRAMPIRMSDILGLDYYVEFSTKLNLFRSIHMTDYYLTILGISPEKIAHAEKEPWLAPQVVSSQRIINWITELRHSWEKVIYINTGSTDIIRRIPTNHIIKIASYFPDCAFVFSTDPQMQDKGDTPLNTFFLDTHNSLNDYFSAIWASDAIISSDSSAYHIAGAFRKPAIALFGPISSSLRVTYYSTVWAIDANYKGSTCSSPCGLNAVTELKHSNTGKMWDINEGCPEAKAKGTIYSPCLLSISLDSVANLLSKVMSLPDGISHENSYHPLIQGISSYNYEI